MVNIHCAYTAEINPSSLNPSSPRMVNIPSNYDSYVHLPATSPLLTRAQVWAGLQRKIRDASEFVGPISSCKVVEENEEKGEVVRVVRFKEDPDKEVREVCRNFWPMKVDFHQEDGSIISNIISDGPSGKQEDLYLTFAFHWVHPDVKEGSDEAEKLRSRHQEVAKMAVDKTIEAIRRLVGQGDLK